MHCLFLGNCPTFLVKHLTHAFVRSNFRICLNFSKIFARSLFSIMHYLTRIFLQYSVLTSLFDRFLIAQTSLCNMLKKAALVIFMNVHLKTSISALSSTHVLCLLEQQIQFLGCDIFTSYITQLQMNCFDSFAELLMQLNTICQ